ncbi:efflux transporter, RND family, MFP subunit, partial [mine drainage metagenome]
PVATVSSGVATYPVTVSITGTPSGLFTGATASVSIIVHVAANVLAVPTSAVHTVGSTSYVTMLVNGKQKRVLVVTGSADALRTQIVSGLKAGEKVVLTQLHVAVPSSTSGLGPRGGFGGGGFGGGAGLGG